MPKKILIFLSIALFLYLFDWFLNSDDENMIYVNDNDIDFLVSTWNEQMQRPPNDEELKTIIENFIQNEVLYREALKLNLDRGDIIVKRRLVQKLGFLKFSSLQSIISPQKFTVPLSGVSRKFTQRSIVLFPEPELPIILTTSPLLATRLMPFKTLFSPNFFSN